MTKFKTFIFSAAGQIAWRVDEDCLVTGAIGNGSVLVSSDPAMTATRLSTPTEDLSSDDFVLSSFYFGAPKIELSKGQKLFITADAASSLQLIIELKTALP